MLLDRAGITLQDSGGWALSTTSAAAALECWLQTVEEDFAHQPLLAVLKSPFIFPDNEREEFDSSGKGVFVRQFYGQLDAVAVTITNPLKKSSSTGTFRRNTKRPAKIAAVVNNAIRAGVSGIASRLW